MVTVSVLPILGVSAFAISEALAAYERSFRERLIETARANAAVVGRGFVAQLTALETLATNPLLDLDDHGRFGGLEGFHDRMVRAAAVMGSPVALSGSDGMVLLHSSLPFGAPLPRTGPPDDLRRVLETGRALVGNLGVSRVLQTNVVPVLVPVKRDGRVVGVLSSTIPPAQISSLLAAQGLTEGRYAAAVDGNGVIVGRSSRADEGFGRQASDWFMRGVAGRPEGLLEGTSVVTGEPVIIGFRRLATAPQWTVLVGEPRAASAAEARRPVMALAVGGAAVLALALACAGWIAVRVLRDVRWLEEQAAFLAAEGDGTRDAEARRLRAENRVTAVQEFGHLSEAMRRADRALRDREERQMLLVREVDHRAKNALAVVQAMVRLTPRSDPQSFQHAIRGRIDALARTHTTLAKGGWRSTDLGELLDAELAPYKGAVKLSGPALAMSANAAQPIAMVAHELATNAAKHGALSMPGGTVSVTWRTADGSLHLHWYEEGGHAPSGPPERRGFGIRMIDANIKGQLGGEVRTTWQPSFACEITVPLRRILREPNVLVHAA
jgi:two-component sensor histidine kinase